MSVTIIGRRLLQAALFATTVVAAPAQHDQQAGFAAMFNPSLPNGHSGGIALAGGAPPVIGGTLSIQLDAQGFDLAHLVVGTGATTGTAVPLGRDAINLYVDPLSIVTAVPMPLRGGTGTVGMTVPPSRALVGLDLAWQAITVSTVNGVGSSNLLASNIGFGSPFGSMVFDFKFKTTIPLGEYWWNNTDKKAMVVHCADADYTVHITGTKSKDVGPLRIDKEANWNKPPHKQVDKGQEIIDLTVQMKKGEYLYFANADEKNEMVVNWTTEIVKP